jgi:hypothetical protein
MGFLAGTAATISLTAGGQTAQASVESWGTASPSGPATVTISPYRTSGIAPAGNMYEVTATGQTGRAYQDVYYVWTFSEAITFDNLPSDFPWPTSNVNTTYGPVTSWVHRTPGAHTVRCDAWDILTGNYLGFDEVAFTANDRSAFGRIILIGTTTNGAPTGSKVRGPYATLAAAFAANASGFSCEILFERGYSTVGLETDRRIRVGTARDNVYLGTYGSATAKPVFGGGVWFDNQTADCVVDGIDFDGGFDAVNPGNNTNYGSDIRNSGAATFTTFFNCVCRGVERLTLGKNVVVCNARILDWGDYGMLLGGDFTNNGYFGLVGVDIAQNPQAVLPPDNEKNKPAGAPFFPMHGPVRLSAPTGPLAFEMCRLTCNNTWGPTAWWPQPLIRWHEINGNNPGDQKLNISRVVGEGTRLLGTPSAGGNADINPQFAVIDKVHMTQIHAGPDSGPGSGLAVIYAGMTVRNTFVVIPDTPETTAMNPPQGNGWGTQVRIGSSYAAFAGVDTADTQFQKGGNEMGPFEFYGNTVLDQRAGANLRAGEVFDGIALESEVDPEAIVVLDNNFTWSAQATGAGAVGTTLAVEATWTPWLSVGISQAEDRSTPPTITRDTHGTTAGSARALAPSAVTGTSGRLPLDDFFGRLRTGTYRGAVDPAATDFPT